MSLVLSTKILSPAQKSVIRDEHIQLIEYDAIEIRPLKIDVEREFDNYIFTSQNAVGPFLNAGLPARNCFCVGNRTQGLLEENGEKVLKMAKNAQVLADFIVKNHKNESFLFFGGNLKRPELASTLKTNKVRLKEIDAYKTLLIPKVIKGSFDGILFFSPSGVTSFVEKNKMKDAIAFCIGDTTAREAKKYSSKVVIANEPMIEEVLALLNRPKIFSDFDNRLEKTDTKHD